MSAFKDPFDPNVTLGACECGEHRSQAEHERAAASSVTPAAARRPSSTCWRGSMWKELIHEEFGDGIMSAINFEMDMTRLPDPKGDRVKIVMHGKFLPYKTC